MGRPRLFGRRRRDADVAADVQQHAPDALVAIRRDIAGAADDIALRDRVEAQRASVKCSAVPATASSLQAGRAISALAFASSSALGSR